MAVLKVRAQTTGPSLQIREADGKLFLEYLPGFTGSGAAAVKFGDNPSTLFESSPTAVFDISEAESVPLIWDVTTHRSGPRGFFSVTEYPGFTSEDFEAEPNYDVLEETLPDYELEMLTGVTYPLAVNTPLKVHFRILDGTTGQLVSINGSVRLALRFTNETEVDFPYTLSPPQLPLSGGVVDGTVTLTTVGSLQRVWLDGLTPEEGHFKTVVPAGLG